MATEEVRSVKEVWICSDGEYSDYRVTAIYSDEAVAKRISQAYGWNDPDVFELDAVEIPSEAQHGLNYYSVHLHPDEGDKSWVQAIKPSDWKGNGWYSASYKRVGDVMRFNALCWAKDKEHAVKIAAERMYQTPRPEKT